MKKIIIIILLVLPSLACMASAAQLTHPTDQPAQPAQLAKTETAMVATCTVTAFETLNLRETPGTDSAVKAILRHGDILTILPDPAQGNWIHVRTQDRNGWINSNYCKGK